VQEINLFAGDRAVEFLEEWVSENMVKPVAGAQRATIQKRAFAQKNV
jgi:hypothetical protein